jgi:hypothetical protein
MPVVLIIRMRKACSSRCSGCVWERSVDLLDRQRWSGERLEEVPAAGRLIVAFGLGRATRVWPPKRAGQKEMIEIHPSSGSHDG